MRPLSTLAPVGLLLAALACHPSPDASSPSAPTGAGTSNVAPLAPEVDGEAMLASIAWLASDQRQGRHTLAPEIHEVATWLADSYELLGLEPVGDALILPYPLRTAVAAGATQRLDIIAKTKTTTLTHGDDFVPLTEGRAGSARGELVFVGYAAQWDRAVQAKLLAPFPGGAEVDVNATPVAAYDDLEGVDLEGKIAVVLAHTPTRPDLRALLVDARQLAGDFADEAAPLREAGDRDGLARLHAKTRKALAERAKLSIGARKLGDGFWAVPDPMAPFDYEQLYAEILAVAASIPQFAFEEGRIEHKLERLRIAGAVGAILVVGPESHVTREAREADALPELEDQNHEGTVIPEHAPFPVVQLRWKQADKLLRIGGQRLSKVQAAINADFVPRSAALGVEVELETEFVDTFVTAPNVVAKIPGRSDEVVLISAHFDHIGHRGFGTCRPSGDDGICNGADDNGSGTAMILDIARAIHATGQTPERTLVFAHFSGEELGLLGSKAFTEDPPFDQSKVVAVVNIDMVGRLGERGLALGGLHTSDGWLPLIRSLGDHGVPLLLDGATTTRSDHVWWFRRQIPVLFLFTGVHDDYHRATDELEAIHAEGLATIGQLGVELIWTLAQGYPIAWGSLAPGEGIGRGLPGDDPSTLLTLDGPSPI